MSVNEKAPLDVNGDEILDPDGNLIDSESVILLTSLGEYLVYRISVSGTIPNFVLTDARLNAAGDVLSDEVMLQSTEVQDEYRTTWPNPKTAPVPAGQFHSHTLGMNFTGAFSATPSYTYKVEVHRINDSLKETLIWVVYESPDQEPEHFKALSVETD